MFKHRKLRHEQRLVSRAVDQISRLAISTRNAPSAAATIDFFARDD
jgi:hypothetical protein